MESVKKIHEVFRTFRGDMNNSWEEFAYLEDMIRNSEKREYELLSLHSNITKIKRIKDAGGMQNRFLSGGNTKKHFIDSIGLFENYISWLAQYVYREYPRKMRGCGMDEKKLFEVILSQDSKQEIINYIAEEKVRSVFYGKPSDVFLKDKLNLEIGIVFKENYQKEIDLYDELTGRRNAIIHNLGYVDKKYLRENPNSKYKEGNKIIISSNYLRGAIALLEGIAAKTTECVILNIYKGDIQGKLSKSLQTFERCSREDWYADLLSE